MATVGAHSVLVPNPEKGQPTSAQHGLFTPEGTLEPDEARNAADHARREAETANSLPQSKPSYTGASDDESDDESTKPPSQEQADEVKRVLNCPRNDHRTILGISKEYDSPNEELEAARNRWIKVGTLLHATYNNTKGATKAFNSMSQLLWLLLFIFTDSYIGALAAAKQSGVGDDDIKEVKLWNGKDEIEELRLNGDGNWVSKNDDMDVESTPGPEIHEIHERATPDLGLLMKNPADEHVKGKLNACNDEIIAINKRNGLSEDHWRDHIINVPTFAAFFEKAGPYLARLQANPGDEDARLEVERLNEEMRRFNNDHHYPSSWTMDLPPKPATQPASAKVTGQAGTTTGIESHSYEVTPDGVPFRKTNRRPGYVYHNGVEKEIVACQSVGRGYRLLLRLLGPNGLHCHNLVAASTFGKGYGASYTTQPGAKHLELGSLSSLNDKSLDMASFSGVASVERDPKNAPKGGWAREVTTIALVGFGEQPTSFAWYTRSTLGRAFGQSAVDEEINQFREAAGQERPLPPTRTAREEI